MTDGDCRDADRADAGPQPAGLRVKPYQRLMSQAGMTPLVGGRLDLPKPKAEEIAAFYRLHRHWRIADVLLPAPVVIHRRQIEPLPTLEDAARFEPTRIDRLDLDRPREIEVSLQRIGDAVLIPSKKGFCLLQGNRIHPLSPAFPMFRRTKLKIERSLGRVAYTGDMYTSENISHFVLDAVVRGYFAKTFAGFGDDEIAFSASRVPYCNHFRSTAFPGAHVLQWNQAHHVEELYVFVHLHHPAQAVFHPAIDFLTSLGTSAAERSPGRLIYVSRRDKARRSLLNERELENRLAALGFETMIAGDLSPEQQIAAFRDAAIVVAPHGAALTNALFMSPGAHLLELFSPLAGTLEFLAIARIRGIDYEYMVGDAVGAESGAWSIDVDAVIARVRGLLEAPARSMAMP